jgi:hypothetical protein
MAFTDVHVDGNNGREKRWLTPNYIVESLGEFDLDPCGAPNHVLAVETFLVEDGQDGLRLPWHGRVWLNPPYGTEAGPFISKLAEHGDGVLLYFARTDTRVFQNEIFGKADAALFLSGRLKFLNADLNVVGNSNAPSVLVAYGERNVSALKLCGLRGKFVRF